MTRCRVLVTGFDPFAGMPRNPSADVARALAEDPRCRAAGVRTSVLPVHRHRAPSRLLALLRAHRPHALIMTGVARGRLHPSVERLGVNCFRRAGDSGPGRPIDAAGPDALFATFPLGPAVRALERGGLRAVISESAGTFACNLVLYLALWWRLNPPPGVTPVPALVGFVHLPATPESLPRRAAGPLATTPLGPMIAAVRSLTLEAAATSPDPGSSIDRPREALLFGVSGRKV